MCMRSSLLPAMTVAVLAEISARRQLLPFQVNAVHSVPWCEGNFCTWSPTHFMWISLLCGYYSRAGLISARTCSAGRNWGNTVCVSIATSVFSEHIIKYTLPRTCMYLRKVCCSLCPPVLLPPVHPLPLSSLQNYPSGSISGNGEDTRGDGVDFHGC